MEGAGTGVTPCPRAGAAGPGAGDGDAGCAVLDCGSGLRASGADAGVETGIDRGVGFGADFGATTSDASAFASESDNGGRDDSSPLDSRSPSDEGGAAAGFPVVGTASDRTVAAGAGADVPPFRPSPPSRDVFLPCLAIEALWRFASPRGNDRENSRRPELPPHDKPP